MEAVQLHGQHKAVDKNDIERERERKRGRKRMERENVCEVLLAPSGPVVLIIPTFNKFIHYHGRRSVGDGGDASPHFSAWWGPHRKCPPPLFGLKS